MDLPYQNCKDKDNRTSARTQDTPPTHPPLKLPLDQKHSYKKDSQLDFLPLELIHNIDMLHVVLVHYNQLNQYWCNTHNITQFFLRVKSITSNTPPLNTTLSTQSSSYLYSKSISLYTYTFLKCTLCLG